MDYEKHGVRAVNYFNDLQRKGYNIIPGIECGYVIKNELIEPVKVK